MLKEIISQTNISSDLKQIADKVFNSERISAEDGLKLYEEAELGYLGMLANFVREKHNHDNTYYNRNFHIEPTNICIHNCKFCSYSRKINQEGSWEHSVDEIIKMVQLQRQTCNGSSYCWRRSSSS